MSRDAVVALYQELIASWNARDANRFAATFTESGTSIGAFHGRPEDAEALTRELRALLP